MKSDLFISHASEDKEKFVGELAKELSENKYIVWYDEFSLKSGDSLRRSIENGIKHSRCGLVVLSHRFFAKEWPQKELDLLFALEIEKRIKIIPIWLDVDYKDILHYAPLLADKLAIKATIGIEEVVEKINTVIKPYEFSSKFIKKKIDSLVNANEKMLLSIIYEAFARLERYTGLLLEEKRIEILNWEELPEDTFVKKYNKKYEEILKELDLSNKVWRSDKDCLEDAESDQVKFLLESWAKGVLTPYEAYDYYFLLNEIYDLDYLFILFGIPNNSITSEDHDFLNSKIIDIGSRNSNNRKFDPKKAYIKSLKKYYGSNYHID